MTPLRLNLCIFNLSVIDTTTLNKKPKPSKAIGLIHFVATERFDVSLQSVEYESPNNPSAVGTKHFHTFGLFHL